MFKTHEETIVVCDDALENETRSMLEEHSCSDSESTPCSDGGIVSSDPRWSVIDRELRAITSELEVLEEYFIKAADCVDISDFTNGERHKLLNMYRELNKLAHVLKTGYYGQKLLNRRDFENELKTFKNDFNFVLRKLAPSSNMLVGDPLLISEQLTTTAQIVEDVKHILTTHFSKQLNWRDFFEQVAVIVLYVSDLALDWLAVSLHWNTAQISRREKASWPYLVNCLLTLTFVHLAAFRTACTYVSNKLLIPFYTLVPGLPIQIMLRQLHTSFKFKRKPERIRFKDVISYYTERENLIFIYSSQVILDAFPQLILQGCILLSILFDPSKSFDMFQFLLLTWVTSLLNLSYACSRGFSFEFVNSSRRTSAFYFIFFLLYNSSRSVSLVMLFTTAKWWFSVAFCLLRFQASLVWLCRHITSSYNIRFTFSRKIVSCLRGSAILSSIPMLCYWSEFPQFWVNALDVFGCLMLAVVNGFELLSLHYVGAVLLVVSVIMSWAFGCVLAWNTRTLSRVFFGSSPEEI